MARTLESAAKTLVHYVREAMRGAAATTPDVDAELQSVIDDFAAADADIARLQAAVPSGARKPDPTRAERQQRFRAAKREKRS